MPIVSHANKENAYAFSYTSLDSLDFYKLTSEQQIKFLDVLLAKDDGKAQAIALGKQLKARLGLGKVAIAEYKKVLKAAEAQRDEALKVIQVARDSSDEVHNAFKGMKDSLEVLEGAIIRKDEADLKEELADEKALRAESQKELKETVAAATLLLNQNQHHADQNVIEKAAALQAAIQEASGSASASGAGPSAA